MSGGYWELLLEVRMTDFKRALTGGALAVHGATRFF